ncbi:MAG: carboxypeptidase-like regulatory domain-containing protein, partial [Bacteroidota bacterium]
MQPAENGRFCAACDKEVRDFTQASNAEILQAYREQHGNVCGRFRREQVNDAYPLRLKQLKRFLCAAILAFGAFLFALDAGAQQTVRQVQEAVLPDTAAPAATNGMKAFRGTVKDADSGEVLPFANVVLTAGGKDYGTVSDFDGNYRITVTDSLASKGNITIKVTFIGYAPIEITYKADADKALTVQLV